MRDLFLSVRHFVLSYILVLTFWAWLLADGWRRVRVGGRAPLLRPRFLAALGFVAVFTLGDILQPPMDSLPFYLILGSFVVLAAVYIALGASAKARTAVPDSGGRG